jgi:hypothetical protein
MSIFASEQPEQPQPKRYQCRHIFPSGHRCGSPALRHEPLCYWHHTTRRPIADLAERRARQSAKASFHLEIPDDRSAIQHSIGTVLQRIAANEIDSKRAGLLLYGLQIAAINLQRSEPAKASQPLPKLRRGPDGLLRYPEPDPESEPIEEITSDETYGTLAPETEIKPPAKRVGFAQPLIDELKRLEAEKAKAAAEKEAAKAAETPTILPTLQACRESVRSRTQKSQSEQSSPKTSKPSGVKSSNSVSSPSETLAGRMRIQHRGLPRPWKTFVPPCDSSAAAPATPSQ